MPRFPRWIDKREEFNLREVGPNLYVGAEASALLRPAGPWRAVIDLYGSSAQPSRANFYEGIGKLVQSPFLDGDSFPRGLLDTIKGVVWTEGRKGPVLIHCQAGLSRSASAAYAMLRAAGLDHDKALKAVETKEYAGEFPRPETLASARRWVHRRRTP